MPHQIRLIIREIFPEDDGSIPTILLEVEDTDLKLKGYFSTGDITFEVDGIHCRPQGALAGSGIVSLGRANYLVRLLRGNRIKFLSEQEVNDLFYSVPKSAKTSILKEELKINGHVEYSFGSNAMSIIFYADLGDFKNEKLFIIGYENNNPILKPSSQFSHITDATKVAKDEFANKLSGLLRSYLDYNSITKLQHYANDCMAYRIETYNTTVKNILNFARTLEKCFSDANLRLLDIQSIENGYILIYDEMPF